MPKAQQQLSGQEELTNWSIYYDEKGLRSPKKIPNKAKWNKIQVPGVWQEQRPDHDGVAWYKINLKFTAEDLEQHLRLYFGAVHYLSVVFVNGKEVLTHEGGYTPFTVSLDEHVHIGNNEITVRVLCPPREYEIEGMRVGSPINQSNLPTWKAGWYYPFGGLWQSVYLERKARIFAEDIFIQPKIDPKSIAVSLRLSNTAEKLGNATVRWQVREWKKNNNFQKYGTGKALAAGEEQCRVGKRGADLHFITNLKKAKLWEMDNPQLYVLEIIVSSDHGEFSITERFGLREFTTDGKYFILNKQRVILKGTLHQGVFPRSIAAPHDLVMARKDLALVKEASGNFVRLHIKPAPAYTLDIADEMGLLCMEEPPIGWITYDEEVVKRAVHNVKGMIKRDRNHPSLVLWCLFNELVDSVYTDHKPDHTLIKPCADAALALDSSRLLIDKSGGIHAAGIKELENGIRVPGRKRPMPIVDEHPYQRIPVKSDSHDRLVHLGKGKKGLLFASEYGTSSFPDMDAVLGAYTPAEQKLGLREYQQMKNYRDGLATGFKKYGFAKEFGTLKKFYKALQYDHCEAINAIQRALRANARNAGYVITQHADAASEFGGIVDLWRKPKEVYKVFKNLNQDTLLMVHVQEPSCTVGAKMPLSVVVSDLHPQRAVVKGELRIRLGRTLFVKKSFTGRVDVAEKLLELQPVFDKAGTYSIEAHAIINGKKYNDIIELRVLSAPAIQRVQVYETLENARSRVESGLAQLLKRNGYDCVPFYNQNHDYSLPLIARFNGRVACQRNSEMQRVVRNFVLKGGTVIIVDSDIASLPHFFKHAMREFYGVGSYAGNIGFARDTSYFSVLGKDGHIGQNYAQGYPRIHVMMDDVLEHGYTPLSTHICPYQFGHPDDINFGCTLFTGTMGRGQFWVNQFHIEEAIEDNAVWKSDFAKLVQRATKALNP